MWLTRPNIVLGPGEKLRMGIEKREKPKTW